MIFDDIATCVPRCSQMFPRCSQAIPGLSPGHDLQTVPRLDRRRLPQLREPRPSLSALAASPLRGVGPTAALRLRRGLPLCRGLRVLGPSADRQQGQKEMVEVPGSCDFVF